jgi:SAM-dependent methyltransferase
MNATQYNNATAEPCRQTIPVARPGLKNGYALDNSHIQAGDRLVALGELFDPGTIHHLKDRGVASGWQCLEVGGGAGSIATWLSERVGPSGRVVVTDINTRFLDALQRPNLEVWTHNIVTDPLPEGAFDLVHVRLLLMHLPERDYVLSRLIKALKPGGWLVDEEYDVRSTRSDPEVNRFERVFTTAFAANRVLTEHGVELRFGRLLHGRLHTLGLAEVGSEARLSMGAGGSVVAKLLRSRCYQLRDEMIEGGYIAAKEFEDDLKRLDDPDLLFLTPTLWAAWGRLPSND